MTAVQIYNQNIADMNRVVQILAEIIREKPVTEKDKDRIKYCGKVVNDVTRKQLLINRKR